MPIDSFDFLLHSCISDDSACTHKGTYLYPPLVN